MNTKQGEPSNSVFSLCLLHNCGVVPLQLAKACPPVVPGPWPAYLCCPSRPRVLSEPGNSTCVSSSSGQRSRRPKAANCRPRGCLCVVIAGARSVTPSPVLRREMKSRKHAPVAASRQPRYWSLATSRPSRSQVRQQLCPEARRAETLQWICCRRKEAKRSK